MDKIFKALADPSRRQLLDLLHQKNAQTLGQLSQKLVMSRQATAKHLGILEAAKLVAIQWEGREKLHFLNAAPIQEIYDRWIHKYESKYLLALSALRDRLEFQAKEEATWPRQTLSTSATSARTRKRSLKH